MVESLQSLFSALLAMAPSALLLWLASTMASLARRDDVPWDRHMRGIAIGMAAAGVWWPLELAAGRSDFGESGALLGQLALLLLAVGMPLAAAITTTGDDSWHSGRRAATAATT
ncbi:MAG: hypothetical protein ABIQ29_08895, partial [Burkholderiaceae bacterium]